LVGLGRYLTGIRFEVRAWVLIVFVGSAPDPCTPPSGNPNPPVGNTRTGGSPASGRGGWETVGMDRGEREVLHRNWVSPRVLLRGLLLAAVLAGIFGMHVLTADDGANGHGSLPMTSIAGMTSIVGMTSGQEMVTTHEPWVVTAAEMTEVAAATVFFPDPGSGMAHGAMAACILFLAAAALILMLFRYRWLARTSGPGSAARSALTGIRRRGPPGRYRPRVALCVIRT
jgi:hypothetical protein